MNILVQMGTIGSSLIDHLITPVTRTSDVTNVSVVCRNRGPEIPKVEYHCPPSLLAKNSLSAICYQYVNLLVLAVMKRPKYVVGFHLFPHGLLAFFTAKVLRKRAIISLIAGPAELYEMGNCALGVDFVHQPLPWFGGFLLWVLKHTDFIVTTGSVTKEYLVKHGVDGSRIVPVISPPNRSRFYPEKVDKVYDVLYVGRLSSEKHNEIFIRAVAEAQKEYPQISACLVGDGEIKVELEALVKNLGIEKNVLFAGYQRDVLSYYNRTKIFVLTSEREGFPNVVLEAMMCGVPCVISNCGDIVDLAKHEYNSIIVPDYRDYRGFAEGIVRLLKDQTLYKTISQNALKTTESNSEEIVVHKWESIINNAR